MVISCCAVGIKALRNSLHTRGNDSSVQSIPSRQASEEPHFHSPFYLCGSESLWFCELQTGVGRWEAGSGLCGCRSPCLAVLQSVISCPFGVSVPSGVGGCPLYSGVRAGLGRVTVHDRDSVLRRGQSVLHSLQCKCEQCTCSHPGCVNTHMYTCTAKDQVPHRTQGFLCS